MNGMPEMHRMLKHVLWPVLLPALMTGMGANRTIAGERIPSAEEIGSVQVLQHETDALAEIFPDADSSYLSILVVDSALAGVLRAQLKRTITDTVFTCYTVFDDGDYLGIAIVADEKGKYRPITFMAGVGPDLRVVDVRVLTYRESRGGEVRHKRFLRQYRGKSGASPIRINRDIINITGATISVHALNVGVRKALAVAAHLRGLPKPEGDAP